MTFVSTIDAATPPDEAEAAPATGTDPGADGGAAEDAKPKPLHAPAAASGAQRATHAAPLPAPAPPAAPQALPGAAPAPQAGQNIAAAAALSPADSAAAAAPQAAAPAAGPPAAPAPAPPPEALSPAAQLGQTFAGLHVGADGSSRLTLQMAPETLGHVRLEIARDTSGAAAIRVQVEHADTLSRLQGDIAHLHQALDRAGVSAQRSLTLHLAPAQETRRPRALSAVAQWPGQHGRPLRRTRAQPGAASPSLPPRSRRRRGRRGHRVRVPPRRARPPARGPQHHRLSQCKGSLPMTVSLNTSLTQAARQAALVNAAAAAPSASGSVAAATGANALQSLGNNFNQFLTLLTTQLKNQDPTSPTDTNQFTQELVQFTGVQQSVATNTNLTQLITLQQGSEVLQSAQVTGHKATVGASQIALQNGTGALAFTTAAAEPVQIAIVNSAGQAVRDVSLTSQPGANSWVWDGKDNAGTKLPDGAYGVAVETGTSSADAAAVPFSVIGTATGLSNGAGGLRLLLGGVAVPLAQVQAIAAQ